MPERVDLQAQGWPLRSLLFVPGQKPDWIRKAPRYKPDALIIDLEDAVPPAEKVAARRTTREGIEHCGSIGLPATVRINHIDAGGLDDIFAITTQGLVAIIHPKSRTVAEVHALDRALSYAEGAAGLPLGTVGIVPLVETAEGMRDAGQLAAASDRVRGLFGAFGGPLVGDVARAFGFRPTYGAQEQFYLASKLVLDSRAAGRDFPIAGIIGTRIDELDAVRDLITKARDFGYAGCALIHPSHVAIANEAFTPTAAEIDYARGLIAAMEEAERSGAGAVSYRGTMVDYAMLPSAHATLAEARRRGLPVD